MAGNSKESIRQGVQTSGAAARPESSVRTALEIMGKSARGLGGFHMNACLRCGLCNDTCHIYLSEPQAANLPAAKASKISSLFRRYHTVAGKFLPGLVGARDLTAEVLDELAEVVYGRCTACGRCSIQCALPPGGCPRDSSARLTTS